MCVCVCLLEFGTYCCVSSVCHWKWNHTLHNGVILCIVCHCTYFSSAWTHIHTHTQTHTRAHTLRHIWRLRFKCHITQHRNGAASYTRGVGFHQRLRGVCVCVFHCSLLAYLWSWIIIFSRTWFRNVAPCFTSHWAGPYSTNRCEGVMETFSERVHVTVNLNLCVFLYRIW